MDAYIALFVAVAKPLLICLATASALLGVLALVSPRTFLSVVTTGNRWVDTNKLFRVPDNKLFRIFDKWHDTDGLAVRYSRMTGIGMLVGAAILGYLYLLG